MDRCLRASGEIPRTRGRVLLKREVVVMGQIIDTWATDDRHVADGTSSGMTDAWQLEFISECGYTNHGQTIKSVFSFMYFGYVFRVK